jgi:4-hydroxybenzoate polyprenyltransferase
MAKKWVIFIGERFPIASHLTMIFVFVLAHFALAGASPLNSKMGLLFSFCTLFFFKLRLYDEIKDYEVDLKHNPGRPLPRGLLKISDLKKMIVVIIGLELSIAACLGQKAFATSVTVICYSLLMFKEFFIGSYLRPHLTSYAVTHTFVTFLLSIALSQAITDTLSFHHIYFALSNWALFNIFEFGRKTFQSDEERPEVESYSSIFGIKGACLLLISQALISFLLISLIEKNAFTLTNTILMLSLFAASLALITKNKKPWGVLYRSYSSAYIVIIMVIFVLQAYIGI